MKKLLTIIILSLLFSENSFASSGTGELKLSDNVINNFQKYLNFRKPTTFWVTEDGLNSYGWRCPYSRCVASGGSDEKNMCERQYGKKCLIFAHRRSVKWKNEQLKNFKGKDKRFSSKDSLNEIKTKLTKLGFYESNNIKKRKPKTSKKYTLKDERPIALQWEGYNNLIAGTIKFDEKNYQGTLKLPLPNNDGICNGSYTLQEGGNGVWQMTCTNNTGASGTLKWDGSGGVTGIGRDYKNKKLKFTV